MSDTPERLPALVATYRLQLHAGFAFGDAAAVLPYLAELGVSHLYLSPILQAVPGSTHGYDQCDPTRISAELGGETGFRHLAAVARAHGMGIVLDIVPNHMATSETNPWWWEILRSGREGQSGVYFDVDWEAPFAGARGRVAVPVLGKPASEVLRDGGITLVDHDGQPALAYRGTHFPVAYPATMAPGETVTQGLLDGQHYELVSWREAPERLNYRRFFDIDSLAALRQEEPAVFVSSHALPLQLVQQGDVQGLRVDHVDGLRDPRAYLETLRQRAPNAWLLVEKILAAGERLAPDWPVDGTTGYDFMSRLSGVFVEPSAKDALTAFYVQFTGEEADYAKVVRRAKLEAARRLFAPDVMRLGRLLETVCGEVGVETSAEERAEVIRLVASELGVYRTYSTAGSDATPEARARVEAAVLGAGESTPGVPRSLLGLVGEVLNMEHASFAATEFAVRFQQFSGPLMAKGVEDTAFYRYNRLVCLNEVGGNPGEFGVAVKDFHEANLEALERHPTAMLASSTHDTKRSEDVRARLSLLTLLPQEWIAAVKRWSATNEPHRRDGLPDRNAEYLLYQTLVGAWPLTVERVHAYMEKAAREARQHTSWVDPNDRYEAALREFIQAVMADVEFRADLAAFVEPLVAPGRAVSLGQSLLKLTAPGVPDTYQGTELWDLSLVDPDNRRPVDYDLRRELLRHQGIDEDHFRSRWDEGLAKMRVTARALTVRRSSPQAFGTHSTYTPLYAEGPASRNLVAYARGTSEDPFAVVVLVPRLVLGDAHAWSGTRLKLSQGSWDEVLWGRPPVAGPWLEVGEVFQRYPLALLERVG